MNKICCRPDSVIRLIEWMKHFLILKNIVFVWRMNKTQFSKVICYNYGDDQSLGDEYLDKFIDFSLKINPLNMVCSIDFRRGNLQIIGIPI